MGSSNSSRKPKGPVSLDDIIAASSPAEQLVSVCVAGSMVAEHQRLEAELERAQAADVTDGRLGAVSQAPKLAKQISDLQARMREHTYTFRFRALTPKAWSDLVAKHPDPDGKRLFNIDTFPQAAIGACCVEPEGMDDPERLGKLLEVLSPAQQSDLFDGAWNANQTAPKELTSYAASAVLRSYETSSSTASGTASPAASSSDG